MTDDEKERKREWLEHPETQALLRTLKTDRARIVDSLVERTASGDYPENMNFIGGQISATDAVIHAIAWGTK